MTAQVKAARKMSHMAFHDVLKGFPNRALLEDRLHQAWLMAQRTQTKLGLLFIDLDRFKLVNDVYGHAAGDAVLVTVANRI